MVILLVADFQHYGKQLLCRVPQALGEAPNTLGKDFVEYNTRRLALGEFSTGKQMFAECQISGTRQSVCRVSKTLGEVKPSAKRGLMASTVTESLPSVRRKTLGKHLQLSRVPSLRHSAKRGHPEPFYYVFAKC